MLDLRWPGGAMERSARYLYLPPDCFPELTQTMLRIVEVISTQLRLIFHASTKEAFDELEEVGSNDAGLGKLDIEPIRITPYLPRNLTKDQLVWIPPVEAYDIIGVRLRFSFHDSLHFAQDVTYATPQSDDDP